MGTYAYILVAGFVIIGGVTAVGMRSDTADANDELHGVHYKEEARDAAVTGLNLTVRRIVNDEGLWTDSTSYKMGETEYRRAVYETFVRIYNGDTVDVTAVGTKEFMDPLGAVIDTTHTIEVKIIRVDLAGGVPPGFDVAILTDQDMDIRGTFEVTSYDPSQNADIHANGRLITRGNSFLVEGYGTYTTGERVRNGENFVPNYDPNGPDPNYMYQDSIEVPPMDVDGLRTSSQGTGLYINGDVAMDQAYLEGVAGTSISSFGDLAAALGYGSDVGTTADNPVYIFSEGTIDFVGDVALDGYGAFVSAGDIHINSNVNIIGEITENFFGHPTTGMGIYAASSGTINGGANIQASVFVDGAADFKGNGSAQITGGLISRTLTSTLNGTLGITWVGPNEGIVEFFGGWRTVTGPVIAAWSEW